MLKARARAGLTQDAVAERMGTTKSAISRLESAGKHAPSLATRVVSVRRSCEPECSLNRKAHSRVPVPGFGASDCRAGCGSHLRYLGASPSE